MSKNEDLVEFTGSEKIKASCSFLIAVYLSVYGTVTAFDVNLRFMDFRVATIFACSFLGALMGIYFLAIVWQYFTEHDKKMGIINDKIEGFFNKGKKFIENSLDHKFKPEKVHAFLKKVNREKMTVFFEMIIGSVVLTVHLIIWITIGVKSLDIASIGIDEYTKMRLLQSLLVIITPAQALLTLNYFIDILKVYSGSDNGNNNQTKQSGYNDQEEEDF